MRITSAQPTTPALHTRPSPLFLSALAGLAIACVAAAAPAVAAERELPLWEAGLGVAAVELPDYRGSDRSRGYVLPVPYFIYRGEYLKADRGGVRSTLFSGYRTELNLSLSASLPVNSSDNPARRGMPNLRPAVELGPTLGINLWTSADRKFKLDLRTPLRTAITIESSPKDIGWLFAPHINLDVKDPAGMGGWNLGMLTGPYFHSRKYNAYFYSVDPAAATASRPAYSAAGGYAGSQFTMALSKRFQRYWLGAFLRYDTLSGAVFEDSPLVTKRNNVSAGVAVSWVFGQSSTMVKVDERAIPE